MATDQITDKNILKSWFKRGLKPLEAQFHAWMDSYWHKDDKIPVASVNNLADVLNKKAESKSLDAHVQDMTIHKTQSEQQKLDNLADNPGATYATKDDIRALINDPDVIIIPVDFTTDTYENDIKGLIQPLFEDGSILKKPVFLRYIWKENYTDESAQVHNCIIAGEIDPVDPGKIIFSSPIKVTEMAYPEEPYAYKVTLSRESVEFDQYKETNALLVKLLAIPYGSEAGESVFFNSIYYKYLGKALVAHKNNFPYILYVVSESGCGLAYLKTERGKVDSNNTIVEVFGTIPTYSKGVFEIYHFHIISDEFLYVDENSLLGAYGTCYAYTSSRIEKASNTLLIDLNLIPEGGTISDEAVKNNIIAQCSKMTDMSKPFELLFIDKAQVIFKPDGVSYNMSETDEAIINTISVTVPDALTETLKDNKLSVVYIQNKTGENLGVLISATTEPDTAIIYLTDNNDGFIAVNDENWRLLDQELLKGKHPVVYLKSKYSGTYCPATYNHAPEDDSSSFVEISYFKMNEGKRELWIERREFTGKGGFFASIYEIDEETSECPIIKVPLDDYVAISRIQLVQEYPTDLSGFKDGDIIIKL